MSEALYATRLYWVGLRHFAKLDGVTVQLHNKPTLAGLRIEAVDYVPEIGLRMVMPYACGWRAMTDEEARAADEVLAAQCGGHRGA